MLRIYYKYNEFKHIIMSKKKEREKAIEQYWARPTPHEIDIVDKGDHLKVVSCNDDVAGWWLGTLRAVYPQDHYSGDGDEIKMHPEQGVTLKLNRHDGTLRIKGKKHLDWFRENFEQILEEGDKEVKHASELSRIINAYLRIDEESMNLNDLLGHLPPCGSFKHGPSYIYRLWRGLLDKWIGQGGDVYVVTPLLDAKRMADILLLLVKHKLSPTRLNLYILHRCDGENKFPKVLKDAKDMIRDLKGNRKKRLVVEERLALAEGKLDTRFGRFHCKMIAGCNEQFEAEILVTSANFHKWNFEVEGGDTVNYFKLKAKDLVNHYLAPLGLAHQVVADSTLPSPTEENFPHPENPSASLDALGTAS